MSRVAGMKIHAARQPPQATGAPAESIVPLPPRLPIAKQLTHWALAQ